MKKSGKPGGTRLWAGAVGVLAAIVFISWSGSYRNAAAFMPMGTKTQTASTAGATKTPASTRIWLPTPTMAPRKSAALPPARTPVLSNIFFPVVEREGVPASFQARLPLVIRTNQMPLASAPLNPDTGLPYKEKIILVDLSEQHVYAFEKGELIFSFAASTGRRNLTRIGHYRILDKIPNAYSAPWGFWMPYWMGIYYAGYNLENGFHSLPVLSNGVQLWGNKIGSPVTYGCVVLMPNDMKKLYRWAGIGTAIVIQK